MTHATQQHGGWARQAQRRGEEYAQCNTCGQRRHPRLTRLAMAQAIDAPPERRTLRGYIVATAAILVFLLVIAQAGIPA